VFSFKLGVFHYLQKQTNADVFSRVNGDDGDSAVGVFHYDVAAVFSSYLKTQSGQDFYHFSGWLRSQAQLMATSTSWKPISSTASLRLTPSASR
jgi:hypothetical protein